MALSLTELLFILAMLALCGLVTHFFLDSKLTSKEKGKLGLFKNERRKYRGK